MELRMRFLIMTVMLLAGFESCHLAAQEKRTELNQRRLASHQVGARAISKVGCSDNGTVATCCGSDGSAFQCSNTRCYQVDPGKYCR